MRASTRSTRALPLDIPRALRALRALSADPDETSHVFTIIDSLSGRAPEHLVALFHRTPEGERLLRERPSIVPVLADRAALRRMPEGSFAHAYLRFVESEGITAEGLVAASDKGRTGVQEAGSELEYASARMRDTHDLWHTITGYKGDLLGETALLAFNLPQVWNPGIALIVLLGIHRVRQPRVLRMVLGGLWRGLRAEHLPAIDWEPLLALPLEEARARLGVVPVDDYAPLRSEALRAEGRLAPRPMVAQPA
ncbi:MAG: Coq4 family protein [Sandaracinus sp.]